MIGSIPKFSRQLWVIAIFRLVPYLVNIICFNLNSNTIAHIYEFLYNLDTVLVTYHFLETGESDRTNIGRDQLLIC